MRMVLTSISWISIVIRLDHFSRSQFIMNSIAHSTCGHDAIIAHRR